MFLFVFSSEELVLKDKINPFPCSLEITHAIRRMQGFNENTTILSFLKVSQVSTTPLQRTESDEKLRLEAITVNVNMNIDVYAYMFFGVFLIINNQTSWIFTKAFPSYIYFSWKREHMRCHMKNPKNLKLFLLSLE